MTLDIRRHAGVVLAVLLGAILLLLLLTRAAAAADVIELLGPGDTVRISVFQNPDMTTEARVSARGTVSFPLLGEVRISGLTPAVAETRIADLLKDGKIIVNPQVNLTVLQVRSRQVSILGQVNRPGKYPLEDVSSKLTDLVALAGGVSAPGADTVTLITTRSGKTEKLEIDLAAMFRSGDLSRNLEILNGDVLFVHRAPIFYIYGEVQRPGAYRLENSMTVMQALSVGGGISLRGTERGIRINRLTGGKVRSVEVKLDDMLQPDDVIYIKESLL